MEINLRAEKKSDYLGIDEVNERASGGRLSILLNLMMFEELQRIFLRYFAVMEALDFMTSSGFPWATMSPPLSPPSGPRSMM